MQVTVLVCASDGVADSRLVRKQGGCLERVRVDVVGVSFVGKRRRLDVFGDGVGDRVLFVFVDGFPRCG